MDDQIKEKSITKAKLKMMSFYDELEKKLKRHPPNEYIPKITKRLYACSQDIAETHKTPPHILLHSIEANCAYHKEAYDEVLDATKFRKIFNLYIDNMDNDFITYTIKENVMRFFLMIRRQQVELLQYNISNNYIARMWRLFVNSQNTIKLQSQFEKKFNISIEQWLHIAFLLTATVINQKNYMFKRTCLSDCTFYDVGQDVVENFYHHTSITTKQVKEEYFNVRENENPAFHFLIKSIFLDRPIIDLEDGHMIAPKPELMFLNSQEKLFELVSSIKGFHKPMSGSFETYTKDLLNGLSSKVGVYTEKILKRLSGGSKSCDFIVETHSEIIFIECKATTYSAKLFTDNAILRNNSTSKIAKGIVQLYTSALNLSEGMFDSLNIDIGKPKIGIVVTLGEIPLVNTNWYFDNFIMESVKEKVDSLEVMFYRPIAISIDGLESLITILSNSEANIQDLFDQKEKDGGEAVGDWGAFLQNNIRKEYDLPPVIVENEKLFYKAMNVDDNHGDEVN